MVIFRIVGIEVDPHRHGDIGIFCRRRDDYLFGSSIKVQGGLFAVREEAGAFQNNIDAKFFPGNFGRIFNDYGWGGYIIWRSGGSKVFIDGRMTGWQAGDKRILSDYQDILTGECRILEEYGVRAAIIRRDEPWKCDFLFDEAYSDEVARVLVRKI